MPLLPDLQTPQPKGRRELELTLHGLLSSPALSAAEGLCVGGLAHRESRILGFNVGKRVLEFLLVFLTLRNASVRVGDKKCFCTDFLEAKELK